MSSDLETQTAEQRRLGARPPGARRTTCSTRTPGTSGARTCPSGPGARCGRTTATAATRGATSRTITPGPGRTGGTRTAWPGSPTSTTICAWALALWNGADPILKERMFGLTGPQGNHGEDVKDYWWYLDALPSHAWLRWRYHYPQAAFPVPAADRGERPPVPGRTRVRAAGHRSLRRRTGTGSVDVAYAKASPTEVLARITVENHGREEATLSVLPTLWFRNTWRVSGAEPPPSLSWTATASWSTIPGCPGTGWRPPRPPTASSPRRCSATTRRTPLGCSGRLRSRAYPKDGINDHVVAGARHGEPRPTAAPRRPGGTGSRCRPVARPRCGCGCTGRMPGPTDGAASRGPAATSTTVMADRGAGGRRVLRGPRAGRHRHASRCGCCARPAPGWSGASRCTRTG